MDVFRHLELLRNTQADRCSPRSLQDANSGIPKAPSTCRRSGKRRHVEVRSSGLASIVMRRHYVRMQNRTTIHNIRVRLISRTADAWR